MRMRDKAGETEQDKVEVRGSESGADDTNGKALLFDDREGNTYPHTGSVLGETLRTSCMQDLY